MADELYTILLVDDEPDILSFIGYNLKKEGYTVHTATDGHDAIVLAKKHVPHLIILDVMMPGMDGIETCKELKRIPELSQTIIAFLTARNEDYSQLAGFDAGGDDYIAKPIKPNLLVSRVKALLRRYHPETRHDEEQAHEDGLRIDRERYVVWKDKMKLSLPRKEFELLCLLVSKPHKVFSREEIFREVWGNEVIVGERTIDVHIRKLREKIGSEYIKTLKGVGYKYTPAQETSE
jgi:two-component system, OmpR family, alkaline phosphatase synthesis response regulator PhoP